MASYDLVPPPFLFYLLRMEMSKVIKKEFNSLLTRDPKPEAFTSHKRHKNGAECLTPETIIRQYLIAAVCALSIYSTANKTAVYLLIIISIFVTSSLQFLLV